MNLFRLLTISLLSILAASNAFSTFQIPDKLVYEGRTYEPFSIMDFPLETYFEKHPGKKEAMRQGLLWSVGFSLSRGYVATYEIQNQKLVLKDIQILRRSGKFDGVRANNWISALDRAFPNQEVLFIEWFTDILVFPEGELTRSQHSGEEVFLGNYVLLDIEKGRVISEKREYGDKASIRSRHLQERARNGDCKSENMFIEHACNTATPEGRAEKEAEVQKRILELERQRKEGF